jgi:hypothetical protein
MHTRLRPDPVDLGLQFTNDLPQEDLHALLAERRNAIAAELAAWRRLHTVADPYLTPMDQMTFRHSLLRLETELSWHDELLEKLPEIRANQPRATDVTEETS